LALSGQDPWDLPGRRWLNIAYALITEGWTNEMRLEFDAQLATAEEQAKRREEQQDRDARRSAGFLGQNVDKMLERAWAARQQALSVLEREAS
jgi:hypothetical protein